LKDNVSDIINLHCHGLGCIAMLTQLAKSFLCLRRRQGHIDDSKATKAQNREKYRYQPLPGHDHFRVLELLPGKSTEIVRCRLHTEQFTHAEDKYAAISYVWGNPTDRVQIVCDDRIIEVTVNLADALSHIRDKAKSRLVWADAICINQDDNTEKGHQVKRMGDVYKNAKEVLVWLGRDSEGIAEDCFNLIRDTTEYLDRHLEIHGKIENIPEITLTSPISFDKSRWNKVRKLVGMPWFSRLWVLQEAALAKQCELLWGVYQLSLAELCELSCAVKSMPEVYNLVGRFAWGKVFDSFVAQCAYQTVDNWTENKPLMKDYKKRFQSQPFLDLLETGRTLEASFEVDRVYAFLGNPLAMKHGDGALLVEPDYSKPVLEIYFEMACSLLAHPREAPYLLVRIDHHSSKCIEGTTLGRDGAFPSWVPRWDKHWRQYSRGASHYWYRAGGLGRKFDTTVQIDKSLLLPAIIFDRVVWTSDVIYDNNLDLELNPDLWDEKTKNANRPFLESLLIEVQQAFSLHCCDRHPDISAKKAFIEDDFSLTIGGDLRVEPDPSNLVEHRRGFAAYLQAARNLQGTHSEHAQTGDAGQNLGASSLHLFTARVGYARNRRFAISESGRFGLVPLFAEPNDVCCICPGMQVPLILRPRADGRYGLVGDSYIHGVMAGEIVEQLDKGEVRLEDVVLV
jgi:hypothetical protein